MAISGFYPVKYVSNNRTVLMPYVTGKFLKYSLLLLAISPNPKYFMVGEGSHMGGDT